MSIHQILLQPTDILFFRDGRPIEGAMTGYGAAWPVPSVTDAALHAALHRAFPVERTDIEGSTTRRFGDHVHRAVRSGAPRDDQRVRRFGSLATAGPFPVSTKDGRETWYFPCPRDLDGSDKTTPVQFPADRPWRWGSLPSPLRYAIGTCAAPSKDSPTKKWIERSAYNCYLEGTAGAQEGVNDDDVFDTEHTIGIAIDPTTQTTGQGEVEGKIYSAQYLRLRDGWKLGQFASARNGESALLNEVINCSKGQPVIVIGGQQRVCTATSRVVGTPPLPVGKTAGFFERNGRWLVKWVLLTPSIWPAMSEGKTVRRESVAGRCKHPGGWLPNWVDSSSGAVLLRRISNDQRRARRRLNASGRGYATDEGGAQSIAANLVAALVSKPILVTGWSLGEALADDVEARRVGAKSAHLAVPAGSIYYFQAETEEDANNLAAALNWHGPDREATEIRNRRSTLMGEKGFGLGVCGTWEFLPRSGRCGSHA